MSGLAARGKAILMISSELAEILAMSDRVIVLHEGRITGLLDRKMQASQGYGTCGGKNQSEAV